jgi:hypothetical protein
MLQAAGALGLGGKFLDHDLRLGKVIYYALEDLARRLQERARKLGILIDYGLVEFETELAPLHLGGAGHGRACRPLRRICHDHNRHDPAGHAGQRFHQGWGAVRRHLGQTADPSAADQSRHRLHPAHAQKLGGVRPRPGRQCAGLTGLTTSADCVLALYTEQGKKGATLKGRGRDLTDIDLALQFDPLTCVWQSLGETAVAKSLETE